VLAEAQRVANDAWRRQFRARMDLKAPDGFSPQALP
jgi:5-methylthioadenosine/S-adenosylhomocysteine deaminase